MVTQREILRGYQAKRLRRNDFLAHIVGGSLLLLILMAVGALKVAAGFIAILALCVVTWFRFRQGSLHEALLDRGAASNALTKLETELPRGDAAAEIIEKLPDPFILLDQAGRIMASNRLTHPLIGQAQAGRHISAVLRAPALLEAVDLVREGQGPQTVEFSLFVPVERHLHAYVATIRMGPERRPGILVVLHDQTALRRAEQMRVDFVANASHELRTPLASLSGFIETLRGPARDDPDARDRFLEIMQDQAARMRRLINDLLSLSRIELNEHVPPDTALDITRLLEDVAKGLMPQAQARGQTIRLDMPDDLPEVLGERDEIHQVLQNLTDNAIKYGAPNTEITITARQDLPANAARSAAECFVHVSVRDRGVGIAREHIPRLTERFYRIDVKRSREQGGTGLGLAIVKHILNRHRGWLTIDSQLGEGSTFTVYIPAAQSKALKPAPGGANLLLDEVVSTKD